VTSAHKPNKIKDFLKEQDIFFYINTFISPIDIHINMIHSYYETFHGELYLHFNIS